MADDKALYQDEAIVLTVRDWQWQDRIATLLLKEKGKLPVLAFGAKRVRQSWNAQLQPLSFLHVSVKLGSRIAVLRGAERSGKLHLPDEQLEAIAYGAVMAEATAGLLPDEEPQPAVFTLLSAAAPALAVHNPRLTALAYLIQLLQLCGYAPDYENCALCQQPAGERPFRLEPLQGGIVCGACEPGEANDPETVVLLQRLGQLQFSQEERFVVRGKQLLEAERFVYRFLQLQMDKPLQSLRFLQQMVGAPSLP